MVKNKDIGKINTYLAIFIYYILPRAQITTGSTQYNILFSSRELLIPVITLIMIIITFQKSNRGKWQSLKLANMVIGLYVFYALASLFFLIILEFLQILK